MKIPSRLKTGDTVAIISLSSGLLGEPFMAQQKALIEKRLEAFGLTLVYTPHALKGQDYLNLHPQARASDLKMGF